MKIFSHDIGVENYWIRWNKKHKKQVLRGKKYD